MFIAWLCAKGLDNSHPRVDMWAKAAKLRRLYRIGA